MPHVMRAIKELKLEIDESYELAEEPSRLRLGLVLVLGSRLGSGLGLERACMESAWSTRSPSPPTSTAERGAARPPASLCSSSQSMILNSPSPGASLPESSMRRWRPRAVPSSEQIQ